MGEKRKVRFKRRVGPDSYVGTRRDEDGSEHEILIREPTEGSPIYPGTEIMTVDAHCDGGWHAAETVYRSGGEGPAQVATDEYREGWDRIFGNKPDVGLA